MSLTLVHSYYIGHPSQTSVVAVTPTTLPIWTTPTTLSVESTPKILPFFATPTPMSFPARHLDQSSKPLPERKLRKDSNKMNLMYLRMLSKLQKFLKDDSMNVNDLNFIKSSSYNLSTIFKKKDTIMDGNERESQVNKYMEFICSHCSFFNFKLLKLTFESLEYEEGMRSLEDYEKEFAKYVERRVVHCPSGLGMNDIDHVTLYVKLDDAYKDCRMHHLETLREDICEILKIETYQLALEGVEDGSICVVFHLRVDLKDKILPLSMEQISVLQHLRYNDARVLGISCGECTQEIHHEHEQGMLT